MKLYMNINTCVLDIFLKILCLKEMFDLVFLRRISEDCNHMIWIHVMCFPD